MPNPCICNLKNFLGQEAAVKLVELMNLGAGSPGSIISQVSSQAAKLSDTKAVVSTGVKNFKDRFGLPPGRIDGMGNLSLNQIKAQAEEMKAKALVAQSAVTEFRTQFPDCGNDPDVMKVVSALDSIGAKLEPLSMIDTQKLDDEIAAAQALIAEAQSLTSDSNRILSLLGGCG